MEDNEVEDSDGVRVGVGVGGTYSHLWWALASAAQLGWGISSYKRGHAGDSRLMPLKAFAVASLFVGATASASMSLLKGSGIHKVSIDSPHSFQGLFSLFLFSVRSQGCFSH
jgi:hypothetical protein